MSNALALYWRRYRALPRLQRELATLGLMLLLAIALLPVAIWIAGQVFLGEYVRDPSGSPTGGFWAFWVDYMAGILRGSPGYWVVFLGPWVLLTAGRAVAALSRQRRAKGDINQPLA